MLEEFLDDYNLYTTERAKGFVDLSALTIHILSNSYNNSNRTSHNNDISININNSLSLINNYKSL